MPFSKKKNFDPHFGATTQTAETKPKPRARVKPESRDETPAAPAEVETPAPVADVVTTTPLPAPAPAPTVDQSAPADDPVADAAKVRSLIPSVPGGASKVREVVGKFGAKFDQLPAADRAKVIAELETLAKGAA